MTPPLDNRPAVMHLLHTLQRGGAEGLVRDLVATQRQRFRFAVVALDSGGPLEAELRSLGVSVEVIGRRPGFDMRCVRQVASLLRRERIDLIHAHQYTPLVYGATGRWWARGDRKLMFTEHGRHYPDRRRLKRVLVNRCLLNHRIDRITAVGRAVRQALIDNECMPADRIRVVHNGIDPHPVAAAPSEARLQSLRRAMRLEPDTSVILQVAGFRTVKDHVTALQTLHHLRRRGDDAVLLLAGDGPTRPAMQRLAGELDLTPHVRFLGNRSDVAALWHLADVGLLTSLSEGISVALLEAMAAGRSVVATDVGGNGEIVVDGHTGYLRPRGDAQGLAEALHPLLIDPALCVRLGEAARQRVLEHFHQDRMHATYEYLYGQLLEASAPGREPATSEHADESREERRAA